MTKEGACFNVSSGCVMQNKTLNPVNTALHFKQKNLSLPRVVNPQYTLKICSCVKNKTTNTQKERNNIKLHNFTERQGHKRQC